MLLKSSLFALLVATLGFAQTRIGNGGNVVDCKKSIQVLDLYEMSESSKYKDEKKKDYKEITHDVFDRLLKISQKLGTQYSERLKTMHDDIDFKDGVALNDVKDSFHVFTPADKDCEIKQIAIRKQLTSPKEKKFVFDKVLWDRLDDQNKSALLVHEIIYEHFNKLGETTSPKVRKVVGYLFQEKLDAKEFWNLIKELKLPIYPD